jgi:hypothetical protein
MPVERRMIGLRNDAIEGTKVQIVLALRRFALQIVAHTNVYDEGHTIGFACRPNTNSLIRNPFRTKLNTCERRRKQTNATPRIHFALRFALVLNLA